MKHSIQSAYEIYKSINTAYKDMDKIPEIFTDDCFTGNHAWGYLQGIEAAVIFYHTAQLMVLEAEDHLWHMIDGDNLVFRWKLWAGEKHNSPFVGGMGQLVFNRDQGKFCFYHGVFDTAEITKIMGNDSAGQIAFKRLQQAQQATQRFQAENQHAADLLEADERFIFYQH